jgi:hypothetical protein
MEGLCMVRGGDGECVNEGGLEGRRENEGGLEGRREGAGGKVVESVGRKSKGIPAVQYSVLVLANTLPNAGQTTLEAKMPCVKKMPASRPRQGDSGGANGPTGNARAPRRWEVIKTLKTWP